jgi:hypothetical protein
MRLANFFLVILFVCSPIVAQQVSRQEVAVGVGASSDTVNGGTSEFNAGDTRGAFNYPEARYTFNFNRAIAVESSISQSFDMFPIGIREGGHQLLALGGVKVGLRGRRFGVFGTADAGVASFSRGQEMFTPDGGIAYQRVTHFAWEQGVALEYYPSPRTILRVDAGELLETEFKRDYVQTPDFSITSLGAVPYHTALSFTVAHRFGRLSDLPAAEPSTYVLRYSVGGFFPMEMREHLLDSDVRAEGGGGAWVGFPLWRFISGDVIAYDHPHDDHTASAQDGGTTFASFAGPKMGVRHGAFGFYVKGRPGIMRSSRVNVFQSTTQNSDGSLDFALRNQPRINFALDTGGVLEYMPPSHALRHAVLRFEGGSTYIHYHGGNLTVQDNTLLPPVPQVVTPSLYTTTTVFYYPPERHSSLLFLVGAGFSF